MDDDPVNLQVLHNHLSLQHYSVTGAANGADALAILEREEEFDLVLLDVMMPKLSGFEVCRLIREKHSRSELPVLLLTAKNRIHDLVTGLESGANDYLEKPFDHQELLARVKTFLELKEAARSQSSLAALKSELEIAYTIQQSLLPRHVPDIPGINVAARYRAMEKVGGDFYDFRVGKNKLGVIMADVSGHGVPAAFIVSMVKIAFRFQGKNLLAPDELMTSINQTLLGNTGDEFVTACYAFLDLEKRELIVTNAGHPPIYVWKKSEEKLYDLRPFGRLLGMFKEPQFDIERFALDAGDRILLYTDGIFEAVGPEGGQFGDDRLRTFIAEHSALSPDEFADKLVDTVTDWSGGEDKMEDDIAMVVVDITAGSAG